MFFNLVGITKSGYLFATLILKNNLFTLKKTNTY